METADNTEVIEAEGTVSDFKPESETKVVKYSVTMAQIAKLQEEYKEVPKDLTVKANYEMVRKAASHLRTLRTDVEKRRKELKADALAWGKLVDGTAKEITEKLLAIEEPFAKAKKDFDTAEEIKKREAALAEEKRVDGIAERIAGIKALVEKNISSTSAAILLDMESIMPTESIDEWAMEFADKARTTINETLAKLDELYNMKLQQETSAAEQAAAEEARKIKEEEDRKQREKEVEEERARLAAEREAMEAEKARLAAEQKIKDDAAAAELKRLADEQAEKDRLQKEKDDAAAAEMAKLKAEMDALRKAAEKPVVVELAEEAPQVVEEASVEKEAHADVDATTTQVEAQAGSQPSEPTTYAEDYRVAGNAMLKYIGNKAMAKALLDAIIAGSIPNVSFTGSNN